MYQPLSIHNGINDHVENYRVKSSSPASPINPLRPHSPFKAKEVGKATVAITYSTITPSTPSTFNTTSFQNHYLYPYTDPSRPRALAKPRLNGKATDSRPLPVRRHTLQPVSSTSPSEMHMTLENIYYHPNIMLHPILTGEQNSEEHANDNGVEMRRASSLEPNVQTPSSISGPPIRFNLRQRRDSTDSNATVRPITPLTTSNSSEIHADPFAFNIDQSEFRESSKASELKAIRKKYSWATESDDVGSNSQVPFLTEIPTTNLHPRFVDGKRCSSPFYDQFKADDKDYPFNRRAVSPIRSGRPISRARLFPRTSNLRQTSAAARRTVEISVSQISGYPDETDLIPDEEMDVVKLPPAVTTPPKPTMTAPSLFKTLDEPIEAGRIPNKLTKKPSQKAVTTTTTSSSTSFNAHQIESGSDAKDLLKKILQEDDQKALAAAAASNVDGLGLDVGQESGNLRYFIERSILLERHESLHSPIPIRRASTPDIAAQARDWVKSKSPVHSLNASTTPPSPTIGGQFSPNLSIMHYFDAKKFKTDSNVEDKNKDTDKDEDLDNPGLTPSSSGFSGVSTLLASPTQQQSNNDINENGNFHGIRIGNDIEGIKAIDFAEINSKLRDLEGRVCFREHGLDEPGLMMSSSVPNSKITSNGNRNSHFNQVFTDRPEELEGEGEDQATKRGRKMERSFSSKSATKFRDFFGIKVKDKEQVKGDPNENIQTPTETSESGQERRRVKRSLTLV